MLSRPLVAALLVGYLLFLAWVLLWPSAAPATGVVGHASGVLADLGLPASLVSPTRVEFGLNALMVVPVPFLASLLWPRWTWAQWTAAGFLASCSVELSQGLFLPDRSAQMADVVSNTLGAMVGGVAAEIFRRAASRREVMQG